MTTLYIVRHGQVENNLKGLLNGSRSDCPLNENGRRQAACLTAPFARIAPDVIYSSPLRRALETARYLRGEQEIPICIEHDLRENDVGDYDGVPRSEIRKNDPMAWMGWNELMYPGFRFPGGSESLQEAADRTADAVADIVRRHRGKTVAVVAHGACLNLMVTKIYNGSVAGMRMLPHMVNASYSHFEIEDDGRFRGVEIAQYRHLPEQYWPKLVRRTPDWMQREHYFAGFAN